METHKESLIKLVDTPTVLTILGATGDLAAKKIYPALYRLFEYEQLPNLLQIIGFSRREFSDDKFRKYVSGVLHSNHVKDFSRLDDFLSHIFYHQGTFDSVDDYKTYANRLGMVDGEWNACSNKLYYLAVPPKFYKTIFSNLHKSGLSEACSDESGWTRVIVEKPFGNDLSTAKELDDMLGELFEEEQIFRIDHYLGKEMLRNILAFRFSNNIFEEAWGNKYIDSIEIKFIETLGVEDRGAFYDGVGALRDVGQNHCLQMLALVTMEVPNDFETGSIRTMRTRLLQDLNPIKSELVAGSTFRAQYKGFTDIEGVDDTSDTETYFKIKAVLSHDKWKGVDITLEGGKALKSPNKEIIVNFKHPSPCLCADNDDHGYHNKVVFSLEPNEEIQIHLWSKKPGYDMQVQEKVFTLPYRSSDDKKTTTEEYEKLLLDCFLGDQTLFVSTDGVEAMWKFIDPIVRAWRDNVVPLEKYERDSDDILTKPDF